jgi:hypothetical protein
VLLLPSAAGWKVWWYNFSIRWSQWHRSWRKWNKHYSL